MGVPMRVAAWLVALCALQAAPQARGLSDQTVQPGAKGSGVVEAVVSLIESQCIFDEDKLFVRRLAWVETFDGLDMDTFRDGYYGGIWKVDEGMFDETQKPATMTILKASIDAIKVSFGITWSAVAWQDLTKPLHSALAARLYLQYQTRNSPIVPRAVDQQAQYWKQYYRLAGDVNYFISTANKLEQGCENGNGADIVFLLDESGSIGASNFLLIKQFVNATSWAFDVGPANSQSRIGVVKFSTAVSPVFNLKQYTTNAQVATAVNAMTYAGGNTYTNLGIDYLRTTSFTTAQGARDIHSFPRVGIVVTDGVSNQPTLTSAAAKAARDAGITLIAVGVGSGINTNELKAIASDPYCRHTIILQTFTEFSSLKDVIQERTCDTGIPIDPVSNSTTGGRLPPGGEQNCKIKIPAEGATVRLETLGGRTWFYIAHSTYPSPDYYEQMVESTPGRDGVIFIPSNSDGNMYCSIKGDNHTESNITIGCEPGDKDQCRDKPCQNGGICVDLRTSFRCDCPPGVTGSRCETVEDPCNNHPCIKGECHSKPDGSYECICEPGFGGIDCDVPVNDCASNPCGDNAECKPIHSGYECCCNVGWTGPQCDQRTNECHSNPCVHGQCIDGNNKYTCYCDDGWTGEDCNIDIDECASNPCVHGECTDLINGYKCGCLAGWTGKNCEVDIDECESNPCINGDCINGPNRFDCSCRPGWTGTHCETDIDDCDPNPCQHGQCEDKINDFLCHCPAGWTGKHCETDINECESSPCLHGDCDDLINGYRCVCHPGYTGDRCIDEINECESDPCEHGGDCEDRINGYVCHCKPGYTGTHCGEEIDECESNPCLYGDCQDLINGYICICNDGWTGDDCDIDIDECASDPCIHGDCIDGIGHYKCVCHPGWTGENCDIDIDDCTPNRCVHGDCTDLLNDYRCTCHPGWTGRDCETEIDECESSPCLYGDCVDGLDQYDCICKPGYHGLRCENETNECESSPCVHGECRDEINGYECICPPGYTGPHCGEDIDECLSNPCLHGDCIDHLDGYVCQCNQGWEGTNCDCVVNNCNPNPCLMGTCENDVGTFKCTCILGFSGHLCDIEPPKSFSRRGKIPLPWQSVAQSELENERRGLIPIRPWQGVAQSDLDNERRVYVPQGLAQPESERAILDSAKSSDRQSTNYARLKLAIAHLFGSSNPYYPETSDKDQNEKREGRIPLPWQSLSESQRSISDSKTVYVSDKKRTGRYDLPYDRTSDKVQDEKRQYWPRPRQSLSESQRSMQKEISATPFGRDSRNEKDQETSRPAASSLFAPDKAPYYPDLNEDERKEKEIAATLFGRDSRNFAQSDSDSDEDKLASDSLFADLPPYYPDTPDIWSTNKENAKRVHEATPGGRYHRPSSSLFDPNVKPHYPDAEGETMDGRGLSERGMSDQADVDAKNLEILEELKMFGENHPERPASSVLFDSSLPAYYPSDPENTADDVIPASGMFGAESVKEEEDDEPSSWYDIYERLRALGKRLDSGSKRQVSDQAPSVGQPYDIADAETFHDPPPVEIRATYDCANHNPCSISNILTGHLYFAHDTREKFIKCNVWGGCTELTCPNGFVWNAIDLICAQS